MKLGKTTTIVFLIFLQFHTKAQNRLDIYIRDSNKAPIPYASVTWAKAFGLVSDSSGYLQIPDVTEIDSVIISAIGYHTLIFYKASLTNKSKIEAVLKRKQIELPEIFVAKYNHEVDVGCIEANHENSFTKNALCTNLQYGLLIKTQNTPAQCKSISVFISKNSSTDIPYRLRLYDIGNNNQPGKDLVTENLIVYKYKTNDWNTYNLDSLFVQLPPNGFFAAIEWLCTDLKSKNGLCIGQTDKLKGSLTYYKFGTTEWLSLNEQLQQHGLENNNVMLKVRIRTLK